MIFKASSTAALSYNLGHANTPNYNFKMGCTYNKHSNDGPTYKFNGVNFYVM